MFEIANYHTTAISYYYPLIVFILSIVCSFFLFKIGRTPFSLVVFPLIMIASYSLEPILSENLSVKINYWAKYRYIWTVAYWSLICSSLFIFGYLFSEIIILRLKPNINRSKISLSNIKNVKCINPLLFLFVVVILLIVVLILNGGIQNLWYSNLERGEVQFQISAYKKIANAILSLFIASVPFFAAIHWLKYKTVKERVIILAILVIVVIYNLHKFSRGAFLPILFFTLTLFFLEQRSRYVVPLFISFILGLFGFWLGVQMRGYVNGYGLVHYFDLEVLFIASKTSLRRGIVSFAGTLSGSNVGAMVVQYNGFGGRSHQMVEYLTLLLPLPSSIAFSLSGITTSLSHDLKLYSVGLPYTALSELLVFMGDKVVYVMFLFGCLMSYIDNYFFL